MSDDGAGLQARPPRASLAAALAAGLLCCGLRDQIVGSSIEEAVTDGVKRFLVRLGPYSQRVQADAAKERLASLGYPGMVREVR